MDYPQLDGGVLGPAWAGDAGSHAPLHSKYGSMATIGLDCDGGPSPAGYHPAMSFDVSSYTHPDLLAQYQDGCVTRPGSCPMSGNAPAPVMIMPPAPHLNPLEGLLFAPDASFGGPPCHRLSRSSCMAAGEDARGRSRASSAGVTEPLGHPLFALDDSSKHTGSTDALDSSPDGDSPGVASAQGLAQDKAPLRSQEQIAEQLIDMFCVPARAPAAQAQAQAPKTGAAYTVREEARAPAPAARHVPVPGVPTTGYACYGMLPPTLPQGAVQVGAAGPWAVRIRPCAPGGQVAGAPVPVTVPSVALSSVGASAVPPASQGSTVPNSPAQSPRPPTPTLSLDQQLQMLLPNNKRLLVTVLATWACLCRMNSRKVLQRALIIWMRVLPRLAIAKLCEIDVGSPVVAALAACFWIAMKCDGHRRSITKASRLAYIAGCSPAALPAAEIYIMDLIDWNPYQGLVAGIQAEKAQAEAAAVAEGAKRAAPEAQCSAWAEECGGDEPQCKRQRVA